MIVVDSNVLSELMRPEPSPAVEAWALAQRPELMFTTAITVAEVMYGIARLPEGRRKQQLHGVATEIFMAFSDRVLSFDESAAQRYAVLVAEREAAGTPGSAFDAQIAAICLDHVAPLATHNVKDFEGCGLTLIDPWER
ncbi:MAG: type II toxin-antitoxin system VapC family toxin [Solirubrobacteraceae bacterium]|nr:type II toxin-antitoxin system VapC family toxin [Solirubrobacteraceae bacterium]